MVRDEHQPWCAQVIAENAELAWRVRCDCKPPKRTKNPRAGAKPVTSQTAHDGEALGLTAGSIPATGAKQ